MPRLLHRSLWQSSTRRLTLELLSHFGFVTNSILTASTLKRLSGHWKDWLRTKAHWKDSAGLGKINYRQLTISRTRYYSKDERDIQCFVLYVLFQHSKCSGGAQWNVAQYNPQLFSSSCSRLLEAHLTTRTHTCDQWHSRVNCENVISGQHSKTTYLYQVVLCFIRGGVAKYQA